VGEREEKSYRLLTGTGTKEAYRLFFQSIKMIVSVFDEERYDVEILNVCSLSTIFRPAHHHV
jgi:hypothetical protein